MKKRYLFLSIIFIAVTISSTQGQKVIRKYFTHTNFDGKQIFKKYEYKYDEKGHLIEEVVSKKEEMMALYSFKTKKKWLYEADNLLKYTISTWSLLESNWKMKMEYESFFTEDNCLSRQIRTTWGAFDVERVDKVGIENEYDCESEWKNEAYWFVNDFIPASKVRRIKTDTSEVQIFEITKNSDIIETGRQERFYNDKGQLLKYYNDYTASAFAHLYLYTYNETNGEIEKRQWLTKKTSVDTWEKKSETRTAYIYDSTTLVQKKVRIEEYDHGSIYLSELFIYDYVYYCDGLLKERAWKNERETESNSTMYEYDMPSECDGNKPSVLKIFPNPFKNKITILSNLLNTNDAYVNLYTINGKLLCRKKIRQRVNEIELDIVNYNEQVIIVQVQTVNRQVSRKIVRLN